MTQQRRRIISHLNSEYYPEGDQLEKWLKELSPSSEAYRVIGLAAVSDATNLDRGTWLLRAIKAYGSRWRVPFEIGPGVRSRAYGIPHLFSDMGSVFRPLFHQVVEQLPRLQAELNEAMEALLNGVAEEKGYGRSGPLDVLIEYFERIGLLLMEPGARLLFNANKTIFLVRYNMYTHERAARIAACRQKYVGTQPNWAMPDGPVHRKTTFAEHATFVEGEKHPVLVPLRFAVDWECPLGQGTERVGPDPPGRRRLF